MNAARLPYCPRGGRQIVRAVVANGSDRAAFDQWYRDEHLPDALKAFGAASAMRGWSSADRLVHTAFYRFKTPGAAQAATSSAAITALIAEFDRRWGTSVTRTRDIMVVAGDLAGTGEDRSNTT